jgi:hypothetical protein
MPEYTLSNFFKINSNAIPVSGEDYYINGTNLFFASSSTVLNSITAIVSNGNNLSSLYLSEFDNLSSLQISEPSLVNFTSSSNLTFISASDIGVSDLVVSGSNFDFFGIFVSPKVKTIDIRNCSNTPNYAFFYNLSLSSIYVSDVTFNTTNFINIYSNNILSENLDTLLNTICSSRTEPDLSMLNIIIDNPQVNTTASKSATASLVERGATVTISII